MSLAHVELRAINECLAKKGLPGRYSLGQGLEQYVTEEITARYVYSEVWGFFSPDGAPSRGYRHPPGSASAVDTLSTGDVGGYEASNECLNAGMQALPGNFHWSSFTTRCILPNGGPARPADDSRIVDARRKWSQCMSGKGYDFADPVVALTQWEDDGKPASQEEISQAVADMDCKKQTNLVGISVVVMSAYDRQYIDQHRDELDNFRNSLQEVMR